MIWKFRYGGYVVDYISAATEEEARNIFSAKHHGRDPDSLEPTTINRIHAIYFSDNPSEAAWFVGTKSEALKAARLYIRQWDLNSTVTRIETITA